MYLFRRPPLGMKRPSATPQSACRQRGAIIVFSSIWMVAFLAFVALAINVFFLGTTLLQQRNAAEYMALAAVKTLTAPASGGGCASFTNDLGKANCIIAKAEHAAAIPAIGASYSRLVEASEMLVASDGSSPMACSSFSPRTDRDFPWCGYRPANNSDRGFIVLGNFDTTTGLFSPAVNGSVGNATAAYVHLNLKNTSSAPLVAPFARLLGGSSNIKMASKAVAYRTGDLILLAQDPLVQTGSYVSPGEATNN